MKVRIQLLVALTCGFSISVRAESATWSADPLSDDWYMAENWIPMTVPNGPHDIATIGHSTVSSVVLPGQSITELDSLILEDDAHITLPDSASLVFEGEGTMSASDNVGINSQPGSSLAFRNSSTSAIGFDNYGQLAFQDNSISSGFLNHGQATFEGNSVAEGEITCYGSSSTDEEGAALSFLDQSATGDIDIIVNPGIFGGNPSTVYFDDDSTPGRVTLILVGEGTLDISGHSPPGLAIEELGYAGGVVYLGGNNLSVTRGYLDGVFSGVIHDGGLFGGTGGSLAKVGGKTDALTLTQANDYSGGTFVEGGILLLQNRTGSATGSGPLQIDAGLLKGAGMITGPVVVNNQGAIAPKVARSDSAALVITLNLSFGAHAQYRVAIDSQNPGMSMIRAGGVTIDPRAYIKFSDSQAGHLNAGMSFTIINNTANNLIAGNFGGLPDGGRVIVGNNTYSVNYEGGDGNDLTLTVVQ